MNRLPAAILLLTAAIILAGCGEAIHNSGEDDSYIHTSTDAPTSAVKGNGPLLPANPGAHWGERITVRHLQTAADAGMAAPNDTQVFSGDRISGGSRTLPGGESGLLMELRQQGQATANRSEYFQTSGGGVSLLAMGGPSQLFSFSPAIPLLHPPIKEGAILHWQGILHAGKQSAAMQAYTRMAYQETLDLPAGKIGAYRVDVVLLVPNGGQSVPLPMVYWFAPGLGIVKQRFIDSSGEVTVELASYARGRH